MDIQSYTSSSPFLSTSTVRYSSGFADAVYTTSTAPSRLPSKRLMQFGTALTVADEVFTSWGVETAKKFDKEVIEHALQELDTGAYGMVLRAKGILMGNDGQWIHFDYVPGEIDVRCGAPGVIGRLCVIGSGIDKEKIKGIFGV